MYNKLTFPAEGTVMSYMGMEFGVIKTEWSCFLRKWNLNKFSDTIIGSFTILYIIMICVYITGITVINTKFEGQKNVWHYTDNQICLYKEQKFSRQIK